MSTKPSFKIGEVVHVYMLGGFEAVVVEDRGDDLLVSIPSAKGWKQLVPKDYCKHVIAK